MTIKEIERRFADISQELRTDDITMERIQELTNEVNALDDMKRSFRESEEARNKTLEEVRKLGVTIPAPTYRTGDHKMDTTNTDLEIRSFQKFLTHQRMDDVEQRALTTTGAAVVIPSSVSNQLITSEKYSDLLYRSTVINDGKPGKISVPIASKTAASWKIQNTMYSTGTTTYEGSPALTNLELSGYELYRWMRMSAASYSLASDDFQSMMLDLLSSEVIETLEKGFIDGTGTDQPTGLDNLSWTTGTNQKLTASAATPIAAAILAEALSLLPQKYARNAILLVNSDMAFQLSQFKGTTEYAYSLADGATKFLGHEVVISEHMADDTAYWVDPKQLYVRFAMPIAIEADKSSGFTAAAIDLRALTVVDSAWNPAACVRVGLGA